MTQIVVDDFRIADQFPVNVDANQLRRLYEKVLKKQSEKPAPFRLLPRGWLELLGAVPNCRTYHNATLGLQVLVSLDIHTETGESYLNFSVSRFDGKVVAYPQMRTVRLAFLGRGRVGLATQPAFVGDPVQVIITSVNGETLPKFTREMVGLPV